MAILNYYYKITPSQPVIELEADVTATTATITGKTVDIKLEYQSNTTEEILGWFLSLGIGEDTLDSIGESVGGVVTQMLQSFVADKKISTNIEEYVQHSFTVEGVDITIKPSSLSLERLDGKLLLNGELELL